MGLYTDTSRLKWIFWTSHHSVLLIDMLLKLSRNLSTRTNGNSGLKIHNNQSMTKTSLTNSLLKTGPRHKKRRVTGRQRRTPKNGVECHWPARFVSVAYSSHYFRRSFVLTTWYHSLFPLHLGGKIVCIEVEVVDASLDYNLFLGRSWTYAMQAVVSTVFRVLLFPHEDRIVTIDQLSFSKPDPSLGVSAVPMIDNPQRGIVNIGVGLCPSLMGTFDYPPPQADVKFISDHHKVEIFQVSSFCMTYFTDPWIFPSPSAMMEGTRNLGMSMPLSIVEVAYSLV
jgi:hypothetical protein